MRTKGEQLVTVIVEIVHCDACGRMAAQGIQAARSEQPGLPLVVTEPRGEWFKTLGTLDLCDSCVGAISNAIRNKQTSVTVGPAQPPKRGDA